MAVSFSGATLVVVAVGLPDLAAAEAARDALVDEDDEAAGKLIYTEGRWASGEKNVA